jgi:hypothetical protein
MRAWPLCVARLFDVSDRMVMSLSTGEVAGDVGAAGGAADRTGGVEMTPGNRAPLAVVESTFL